MSTQFQKYHNEPLGVRVLLKRPHHARPLKILFSLCVPLFFLHAVEEYVTGFYSTDHSFRLLAHLFALNDHPRIAFFGLQFILAIILVLSLLVFYKSRPRILFLAFPGLLLLFEVTHLTAALKTRHYFPGLITGTILLAIGVIYCGIFASEVLISTREEKGPTP